MVSNSRKPPNNQLVGRNYAGVKNSDKNLHRARDLCESKEFAKRLGVTVQKLQQKVLEPIALGRLDTPDDVAEVVALLSSPVASYLTGFALPVFGGKKAGIV